jgi:TM2 domain-containing membrane protein YozV
VRELLGGAVRRAAAADHRRPAASRKEVLTTYILWFFLGIFGVHRLYLGRTGSGCLYALTGAFCTLGLWWDLFMIPSMVDEANA